jgi:anti-sigma factor RsiW
MKCAKVRKNLSAYLDGQLEEKEKVFLEEHLRSCFSCQEEYNLFQRVDGLLEKIEPIEPTETFHPRLWQKIHSLGKEHWLEKLGTFFPFPLTAKVAFVFLLGIFIGSVSFFIQRGKIERQFRNDYSLSFALRSFADIPTNSLEEVVESVER